MTYTEKFLARLLSVVAFLLWPLTLPLPAIFRFLGIWPWAGESSFDDWLEGWVYYARVVVSGNPDDLEDS